MHVLTYMHIQHPALNIFVDILFASDHRKFSVSLGFTIRKRFEERTFERKM